MKLGSVRLSLGQSRQHRVEYFGRRAVAAQVKHHSTCSDSNAGSNLQQTQTNRVDSPASRLRPRQGQSTDPVQEHIRKRRQQQPKLVCQELCATRPVRKQTQLLFLDPVLHLAPLTVDLAVERFRIDRRCALRARILDFANAFAADQYSMVRRVDDACAGWNVRHHETWVGPLPLY